MNSKYTKNPAARVARVRLSELKALIREAVEEAMQQQQQDETLEIDEADLDEYGMGEMEMEEMEEMDELDQGWGDDTDYTGGEEGKPSGQDDKKYQWKPEEEYKGSY
jgi:hypothetical protein